MGKLTGLPEAQSFDENDILVKDGTNGTKKIKIEKVLEYMVDPTLTTPGKAADAKATKDAIDAVGDVKTQLKKDDNTLLLQYGVNRYIPLEVGAITDSGEYTNNTARARTPSGTLLSLSVGDVVGLDSFSNYGVMLMRFSEGAVAQIIRWEEADFTIETAGDYAIVIKTMDSSDINLTDVKEKLRIILHDSVLKRVDAFDTFANANKEVKRLTVGSENSFIKQVGVERYIEFEYGNILDNGTYAASTDRVRTRQGSLITLNAGDVVGLDYYTDWDFMLMRFNNGSVAQIIRWNDEDKTIETSGTYAIVCRKVAAQTIDPVTISELFKIIRKDSVVNLKTNVSNLENTVYPTVPNYFNEQIAMKETAVLLKLRACGKNKSAFVFITDQHEKVDWVDVSPRLVRKFVTDVPTLQTVFGGGDVVSYNADKNIAFGLAYNYLKEMDFLDQKIMQVIGNHETNPSGQAGQDPDERLSLDEVYVLLQEQMEHNPFITWGPNFTFYYDSPSEKTRYLCCSTGRFQIPTADMRFYVDALEKTPDGWHIVCITHIIINPPDSQHATNYFPRYAKRLLDLLELYNSRESGNIYGCDASTDLTTAVPYNFTNCTGKVEGVIAGHYHNDLTVYSDGDEGTPIPILICDTASNSDKEYAPHDNPPVQGTITETAISIIIFDYSNSNICMYRIGRGSNIIMPFTET